LTESLDLPWLELAKKHQRFASAVGARAVVRMEPLVVG
jgi:hypothetical protein